MPKVRLYRTTREKREAMGDETVTVQELERWLQNEDRVKHFPAEDGGFYNYHPDDVYEWRPNFPAGYPMYSTTIPEEALMSSNYDAIIEAFKDAGLEDVVSGSSSSGTFDIAGDEPETMNALALACKLDEMAENYPVLDEELMSEREHEYLREQYNDYGREAAIEALAENGSELIDEWGELEEKYASIVEPYLFRLADSAVAYSGELYFGYSSEYHGPDWPELKYALEEVCGVYMERPRPELPELVERFDTMIRLEKQEADRVEFEKFQSPIEGMEV